MEFICYPYTDINKTATQLNYRVPLKFDNHVGRTMFNGSLTELVITEVLNEKVQQNKWNLRKYSTLQPFAANRVPP